MFSQHEFDQQVDSQYFRVVLFPKKIKELFYNSIFLDAKLHNNDYYEQNCLFK